MLEFDLIDRLREIIDVPIPPGRGSCPLGIGDDAALLDIPPGQQLVVCCDTLVAGVHFPEDTGAEAVGHKALAVNLSDLAAMGAEPAWFLLALTLPEGDRAWVDPFARGMGRLARSAGIALVGGDTTSGLLSVTVTAAGVAAPGQALRRSGAKPGDRILLSASTGLAARALQQLQSGTEPDPDCLQALDFPAPRLKLGRGLRGLATACIDVSDGLAADLGHILEQSGTGARLELERLPVPPCLSGLPEEHRWALQLSGGDDYELCFTVPAQRLGEARELGRRLGLELAEIGEITAGAGLQLVRPEGNEFELDGAGYCHFSAREQGRH